MSKFILNLSFFILFVVIFILPIFNPIANADSGEQIFQSKGCVACHTIGKGKLTGPDLLGVTKRRNEEWLREWLKSPDTMILTDPIAKELLKEYFVPMPNQGLSDEQIESLIEFFEENDEKAEN